MHPPLGRTQGIVIDTEGPPETEPSAATFTIGRPHRAIRRFFARGHVGFVDDSAGFGSWIEPPTGQVTVIVNLGEAFGGYPTAFVAGLTDTHEAIEPGGAITCLDLKLTPPGARSLLGAPLQELTGSTASLPDVFGPAAGDLVEQLRAIPSWTERFEHLDAFLLGRVDEQSATDRRIEWAWEQIMTSRGRRPVGDLASQIGWSQRHFIQKFRRELGLPPKTLARIVRFNHLLRGLDSRKVQDWAALAAEHGYYDQAHLIRDCREFTGTTPTKLILPAAGIATTDDEVNSFQSPRPASG